MTFGSSSSISAKLTRMSVMVSGLALLLAVVAFFVFDLISFRQNLIRNLDTAAQIVGSNSVSALLFDDPQSAATTLEALGNSPDVISHRVDTHFQLICNLFVNQSLGQRSQHCMFLR